MNVICAQPIDAIMRDEVDRWTASKDSSMPRAVVIAILFCFKLRLTTGKTFEEYFHDGKPELDYQI